MKLISSSLAEQTRVGGGGGAAEMTSCPPPSGLLGTKRTAGTGRWAHGHEEEPMGRPGVRRASPVRDGRTSLARSSLLSPCAPASKAWQAEGKYIINKKKELRRRDTPVSTH